MDLSTEKLSDTRAKVTVTLKGEEIAAEERNALRAISSQARVPGFRPGKAPESLLRSRFGKQIEEETKQKAFQKAYKHATDESELKIFGLVDVSEAEVKAGQDASIDFTFDLMPEFELPEYTGIETKVRPADVSDEDVEKEVQNLLRSRAEYNVVEREAAAGDYVKVSYKGEIDGQPISELTDKRIWGTQENTWEEAGEANADTLGVPAIVEGIVGMKAGDKKEVTQDFEDNHEVEALRGKKGTYQVEVHEVRERKLPELTEEFLKSIQVESEEDLRKRIGDELKRRKENERRTSQRNQIADYLVGAVDFPVPESAIDAETDRTIERVMRENMQRGVPQEEIEKHKDELASKSREMAALQVKRDFILGRIGDKEEIKVTNEDLQRAIMAQSMRFRIRPDELVKELQKDREALRSLQNGVLLDKILEWLADKANVVESEDAPVEEAESHAH